MQSQPQPEGLDLSFFIPPDPTKTVLVAAVVPGAALLFVLALVWWSRCSADDPRNARGHRGRLPWIVPLAIAGVAVFAECMIRGWPESLWPPQVGNRFIAIAGGLGVAGLAQSLLPRHWASSLIAVGLVAAVFGLAFVAPATGNEAKAAEAWWHLAAVSVVLAVALAGLDATHESVRGWLVPLAAWAPLSLAGPVLVLANTAPAAQLSAILPAALGAAVVVGVFRGPLTLGRGGWAVLLGWHVVLVGYNSLWGWKGLTAVPAALLAAAPAAGALVAAPGVRRLHWAARLAVAWVVGGSMAMAALVMAYRAAAAAPPAYY